MTSGRPGPVEHEPRHDRVRDEDADRERGAEVQPKAEPGTRPSRRRSIFHAVSYGVVGKALGFLIPVIVAAAYGVSRDTDSFFLAFAIAMAVTGVWGMSLEQFAVPLLSEVEGPVGTTVRLRWLGRRILVGTSITWALSGVGLLAYLARSSTWEIGTRVMLMFLCLTPQVLLAGLVAPYAAYLTSRGEYRWPSGSAGIRALGVLTVMILAPREVGLISVAIGYSLGEGLRFSALRAVALRRLASEHGASASSPPAPGTVRRAGEQMSSMALASIGPVAERSAAAALGVGAVTQLEYAMKLFYVPSVVFDANVVSVFLSSWSRLVAAARWTELRHDVHRATLGVFVTAAGVALTLFLLREPLVALVLARGAFPPDQVGPVARLFGILMLALPFATSAGLASAAYIAMSANRLLLQISALKTLVRVGGLVLLAPRMGLAGIAAAFVAMHVIEWLVSYALVMRLARSRAQGGRVITPEHAPHGAG